LASRSPGTPGWYEDSTTTRILLACDAEGTFPLPERTTDVFVVDVTGGEAARDLVAELRRAGLRADRAWDQRAMRAQMKAADRSGARLAIIVGEREVSEGIVGLRRLRGEVNEGDGAQERVNRAALLGELRNELAETNPTDPPA